MGKYISVAIDGPSGAGKSTIAKMCAQKLGFLYIDTGAIYRTVGVAVRAAGLDSKDEAGVTALLPRIDITMRHDEKGLQRMFLDGRDVTDEIREPEISIYASDVSAMPAVRAFLLNKQRNFALTNNVIMDGRDIGTVVLPDADVKLFLTATAEERANRRFEELLLRSIQTTLDEVLRDIIYRDNNDSTRSAAPLCPAENAVIIDTTGNSLEKSFQLICSLIEGKMAL